MLPGNAAAVRARRVGAEAAALHRARKALHERLVVVDDQQRALGYVGQRRDVTHGVPLFFQPLVED
jgi:hypothetical protein